MAEIGKLISVDISNIAKIFGIAKANIDKVIGISMPVGIVGGDRGVFGGGYDGVNYYNVMDYVTISTTGDAIDFGDLTRKLYGMAGTSNGSLNRGVFAGGYDGGVQNDDKYYINITSLGNGVIYASLWYDTRVFYLGATSNNSNNRGVWVNGGRDAANRHENISYQSLTGTGVDSHFGNTRDNEPKWGVACTSNGTNERGIIMGGQLENLSLVKNWIDYITISTTGNSTTFGDLTRISTYGCATSNLTNDRGLYAGGSAPTNTIEYITISTTGNAADFGDLTLGRSFLAGTSNGTNNRAVFGGGYTGVRQNVIDYVTITSLGAATNFGDLTQTINALAATSNA